jgi:hypothetical protein
MIDLRSTSSFSSSSFFCLWYGCPGSLYCLLKRFSFFQSDFDILTEYHLTLHSRVYFWALSHWSVSLPYSDDFNFVIYFDIRKCGSFNLFLVKTVLSIWGSKRIHMNFMVNFSIYPKNNFGILIVITLNLYHRCGYGGHLNNIMFSNP